MITQEQKDKCLELIPELYFNSKDKDVIAEIETGGMSIDFNNLKKVCEILDVDDIDFSPTSSTYGYISFYPKK